MENKFNIKELESVILTATNNMTVNGTFYDRDETVLFFDKVQLVQITQTVERYVAEGGKHNMGLIDWENTKEVQFQLKDGLTSYTGLNFITNSLHRRGNILFPERVSTISNSMGVCTLEHNLYEDKPFFINIIENGFIKTRINGTLIDSKHIQLESEYSDTACLIDYYYIIENKQLLSIGGENFQGYLRMTAKINAVEQEDGLQKQILFVMPKIKIMSNLDMVIGTKATPVVTNFMFNAFPDPKDGKTLARFIY